jgi:tetratricopeptide (TPR) repeat protein
MLVVKSGSALGVCMRHAVATLLVLAVLALGAQAVSAQPADTLKARAVDAFRLQDYSRAIQYLKQAVRLAPKDAQLYYYLGYYTHYLCYDSVPLPGYGPAVSDSIVGYLNKALSLDPSLGDARYFLGSEHGARGLYALERGDVKGFVKELELGRQTGGYPDWLLEYGRNILRSCRPNAILFTTGDAEVLPIWYCQFVEHFRQDVAQVPLALMQRPWFVLLLKKGLGDSFKRQPILWSEQQILEMRPYKWDTRVITLPVPPPARSQFGMPDTATTFKWTLNPDLQSGDTGLLGAHRALMADMIEANQWKRPVQCSLGALLPGLDDNLQLTGCAMQLLPFDVARAGRDIDYDNCILVLSDAGNFKSLPTLARTDMPRVSYVLQNYWVAALRTVYGLLQSGDRERARALFEKAEANMPAEVLPVREEVKANLDTIRGMLEAPAK